MKKTYETTVPEGYEEVYHIDAGNSKTGLIFNLLALLMMYQRLGFKIAYEYPGVHEVPCYKMYYKR